MAAFVASNVLLIAVVPLATVPGSDAHGLRVAGQVVIWGIIGAAGVVVLARAVFGEVRRPRVADVAVALTGVLAAGVVQFAFYRWLVERQGFYGELGLIYRWINEPALLIAASTSLFAIAVGPANSVPPRAALALSAIVGLAVALRNVPGARDGISPVGLWLLGGVVLATVYFIGLAAWGLLRSKGLIAQP